jgi:hypothetical protein
VSDNSEKKHELAEAQKQILRVMDAGKHKQDQERSPWTWRSIRDGGLGFLNLDLCFCGDGFYCQRSIEELVFRRVFRP